MMVDAKCFTNPAEWRPLPYDSNGTQWIALGRGCEFHLLIPTPRLETQIEESPQIKILCAHKFSTLFRKVTMLQLRHPETFREDVTAQLPPSQASRLIGLCSARKKPQIFWTRYARARRNKSVR